jgi:hypothetical protein
MLDKQELGLALFTLIQAGGVLPLREEYDKHFEIVSAKGCNLVRVPISN